MDNSNSPIGPGFKKTELKAGMRIRFPYQNQQFTGTITGFNLIEGKDIMFVDGIAYIWSDFDLRPVYEIVKEIVKPDMVKKKAANKAIYGKSIEDKRKAIKAKKMAGFKLVKRLQK